MIEKATGQHPVLAPSAMHDRYAGVTRLLFEKLFGPIHYPAECAERVRALAQQGVVVYVSRARSTLLVLYFNHALSRLGLPLASFVGGISLFLWQPVDRLWKLLRQRHEPTQGLFRARYAPTRPPRSEAVLADNLLRGLPAFLVLGRRHQKTLPPVLDFFRKKRHDYFRALVAAQRVSDKPIFVVPHVLTSRLMSGSTSKGLTDRLFGDTREPTALRETAMLLSTLRRATVRVGHVINLKELAAAHADLDDWAVARRLLHDVQQRIQEEERIIAGPPLPTYQTTARHVLREPALRREIEAHAQNKGLSKRAVDKQVLHHLRSIAARYSVRVIQLADHLLDWVFHRIYDGIAVDEPGLTRVMEAARRGPLVFCPSHKSHIDYLVLSFVLWRHGVTPPHIAAGANLSFFPAGSVFRRCGAFFLRRSFRDDKLYGAVFRAYVTELLRRGTSIEFFLEGTRSRTGKLLMPRLGLLSMLVEAWRSGARGSNFRSPGNDVIFVPVSIDYERIIEAGSFESELHGNEKKTEDIGGLLQTPKVLRSRYGRVYLNFGDPVSLQEFAVARGLIDDQATLHQGSQPENKAVWQREIERLGYLLLRNVANLSAVTPTAIVATTLMGNKKRGMAQTTLLKRAHQMVGYLESVRARLTGSLQNPATREASFVEALKKLCKEHMVSAERPGRTDSEPICRVPEERRVQLDFYKNALMNYFAPASIIARSVLRHHNAHPNEPMAYVDLRSDTQFLSRLLKREFLFRADSSFDTYFDDTLNMLTTRGVLGSRDADHLEMKQPEALAMLGSFLDSFIEAYWVVVTTLAELREFPLWDKELADRAQANARRTYLEGNISRPEAAGRVLVVSAVGLFESLGVVTSKIIGKRKTYTLSEQYDPQRFEALTEQIRSFL